MHDRAVTALLLGTLLVACTSGTDGTPDNTSGGTADSPSGPVDAATLEAEGAFDSGAGAALTLNPATEVRLRGRVVAELGFEPHAVAVASDGGIGVLVGITLSILVDDGQVAAREVASLPVGGPLDSRAMAFDADGTLWAWTGDALVGLRRDGEAVDIDHDVADALSELRITGTNVSIVSDAAVVPLVGEDPLSGSYTVDEIPHDELPTMPEEGDPDGVPVYASGPGVEFGPEFLASVSIMGSTLVQWDGQPLSDGEGRVVRLAQSQIVADTVAAMAWVSAYDGSFLVVHRGDGPAVAALVDGGPYEAVSVSPNGAVHVIAVQDGTTTIRTVLTGDLRPVQPRPAGDSAEDAVPAPPPGGDTDGSASASACRGGDEDLRVDQIDLDGDGLDDQARLHVVAGRLTVCTGDGQTHDLPAWDDSWVGLEAVDLGGHPGIALVRPGRDADDDERSVVFVRWVDGEFGAVGAQRPGDVSRRWAIRYEERGPSTSEVQLVYGCRASTFTRPDTGEEADFEVAQLAFDSVSQRNSSVPRVEVFLFVDAVYGLSDIWDVKSRYPVRGDQLDLRQFPDLTPQSDPKQLLRDLGFTPRCTPQE